MKMSILVLLLCTATQAAAAEAGKEMADAVLTELNSARTNPHGFAAKVDDYRRNFHGKGVRYDGATIMTSEGVGAVNEALRFLRRAKPLPPLIPSAGLAAAAADLAAEESKSGTTGHTGRQSGGMAERIGRHGAWSGSIGENISYGPADARLAVIQLIVDDGVPGRGHRTNIFSAAFREAGVSCAPHPRFGAVCVTDFATSFSTGRSTR